MEERKPMEGWRNKKNINVKNKRTKRRRGKIRNGGQKVGNNGAKGRSLFPMTQQPLLGQGVLIIEASRSQSDTPHSEEFPWTRDQPVAETST
jgi:hypothetical protein